MEQAVDWHQPLPLPEPVHQNLAWLVQLAWSVGQACEEQAVPMATQVPLHRNWVEEQPEVEVLVLPAGQLAAV